MPAKRVEFFVLFSEDGILYVLKFQTGTRTNRDTLQGLTGQCTPVTGGRTVSSVDKYRKLTS